jgi:hypothetical protein
MAKVLISFIGRISVDESVTQLSVTNSRFLGWRS